MKNNEKKKMGAGKIILLIILGLVVLVAAAVGLFFNHNLNYYKAPMRAVERAGFEEKQVTLDDCTVINYAEGGEGEPLLLIHGQTVQWEDYMDVLPQLAKSFHVYAVDCYGHGQSSHNAEKYSAEANGEDLNWFIENVIGEPCIVSGHSSGGLITGWLAANHGENVRGIVLEDPPFFTTEADRLEEGFAYYDTFIVAHNFMPQSVTNDYPLYYLEHCEWLTYFGESREPILNYAKSYRMEHPDEPIKIFFLPPSMTRVLLFLDDYDPRFGDAFYTGSWMKNFDHEETLKKIDVPTVLIHNNWSYDEDGILLSAMNGDDAQRVAELIDDCELINLDSGHDSHAEVPKEFIKILQDFADGLQ